MTASPFHIYSKARELAAYITEGGKLLPVFASSNIKIYPYQIAAAQFALRSPYLKGVVLADEGSLGKTYEALLIAAQRWYEGKERQLLILPTNLIKQWIQKIETSFTLPYVLIDSEEKFKLHIDNPFEQQALVITTYDFAVKEAEQIEKVKWDLVIFDEASFLSKSYTGENKTSNVLKQATNGAFKLLLTPTPITISIMDIYGLLWFIDETLLPDEKSFYDRYFRKPENYGELSEWVSQYCFRTLKSQVTDYVNFSQRVPYTVSYELTKSEKGLYAQLDEYLALPTKLAYPKMERYDLTLMYYHIVSSSSQALCRTLEGAINRIEDGQEKELLKEIVISCQHAEVSGKMKKLLEVLQKAFTRLSKLGIDKKAIIFTDNRTTQKVLNDLLSDSGYGVLTYSGQNSRDYSIMERFRSDKSINIVVATDEAAKGLDIEFCPIVVNYDLLYNAVELEQRITRCHRQGQSSDVLVINLLCRDNFADVRIMELINKRVLQFGGIFGLSDNILGNFDVDIDEVLKTLRHCDDIREAFSDNLTAHKRKNRELVQNTEASIFTSFTQEIADKITLAPDYIEAKIERINSRLWDVVSWYFNDFDGGYIVDKLNRTITAPEGDLSELFYYWSGSRNRLYRSLKQYGMSPGFKPHHGRITLTSVLGRSVLNEICCASSGSITVDAEIEPCMIGFYGITVCSKTEQESVTYYTFIGETASGAILSDDMCRQIMELPIGGYYENQENSTRSSYNSRTFTVTREKPHKIDAYLSVDECVARHIAEREPVLLEQVSVMKRGVAIAKTALERNTASLKVEIKSAEKVLAEATDRIGKIQADKKCKLLRNDLRKQEDGLFMDHMRMDLELEKEIDTFTDKQQFKVEVLRHFLVEVLGVNRTN